MLPKYHLKLLFLLFIFFLLIFSTKTAYAQNWIDSNSQHYAETLDTCREGSQALECYVGVVNDNTINDLNCKFGGAFCTTKPENAQNFFQKSVIGQSANYIAALYSDPPASSGLWLADTASNLGIVPKTYAQGIGFSALQPILPLWKAMRNVAYAFLIIVLLVIGLMIMFRSKIDPRTVISIQTALPRIVITLILITFSYPIAGFLIDLMYVFLFLGISVITSAAPSTLNLTPNAASVNNITDLQATFSGGAGLWRIFWSIPDSVQTGAATSVVTGGILATVLFFFGGPIAGVAGGIIGGVLGNFLGPMGGSLLSGGQIAAGGSAIVLLLILILMFFVLIRLFFLLLNAYIQIIINIIFAPIFLLGHAIPGQTTFTFSAWVKGLLSNIIVFPATAILILIGNIVANVMIGSDPNKLYWAPPMMGGAGVARAFIGLGFALVTPQIVNSIKKMFGAKPLIPVGGAVGAALNQPMGIAQQAFNTFYQFRMLQPKK